MPATITIDQLKEGMELASPVKNKVGQVILPANIAIEQKHIRLLQTWGIQAVSIKADANESPEIIIDAAMLTEAKELLEKRLKWKPENHLDQEIYDMGLAKILEKSN